MALKQENSWIRELKPWQSSMIVIVFLMMLSLVLSGASLAPANETQPEVNARITLRLPWVRGAFRISGYTYGCFTHTDQPGTIYRDSYAIDFGLPWGTQVAAVADGIAHTALTGLNWGHGYFIWIAHTDAKGRLNGYISLYAHLSSFHIRDGQHVKGGQWIGNSGSTGNSLGPHLHFSLRYGFDGTHIQSAAPARAEPMSGYKGFGQYGVNAVNGCQGFVSSPAFRV